MLIAIAIVVVLFSATVIIHYESLFFLSNFVRGLHTGTRQKMLIINFVVIAIHLVEIVIYGVGYWFGDIVVDIGDFVGHAVTFKDYVYFSMETYTTLGLGDIYPNGNLRLIASVESLNGLLMLGWSASFTFIAMQRYWDLARQERHH
jgi:hypothetical protein